jgi:hypothetical protein
VTYPNPGQPTYQQPPPAPRRPWYRRKLFLIPAGIVVAIIVLASMSGGAEPAPTATAPAAPATTAAQAAPPATAAPTTAAPTTEAPAPAPASGLATTFGDGDWLVGTDIAPGSYRSPGVDGSLCSYNTHDESGDVVLEPGMFDAKQDGPSRVTLEEGWTFQTSGCEDFVLQP